MAYLFVQILLFLVLAGLLGGLLVYLYFRWRFEDVTESYSVLERAVETQPTLGLEPLEQRLAAIEAQLSALAGSGRSPPTLDPMVERLERLEARLSALASRSAPNLEPMTEHLERLETQLLAVAGKSVPDLDPMAERLERLETQLLAVAGKSVPDLDPMAERLERLEAQLQRIALPDLGALNTRLDDLKEPDLGPLSGQLVELKAQMDRLEARSLTPVTPAMKAPLPASAKPPVVLAERPADYEALRRDDGSKNLLTGPAFGDPDDLKLISGVGPVLEKMLHDIGVFYFWQVADWTSEDVAFVDGRLTAFHGRIERDSWVEQAHSLQGRSAHGDGPSNGEALSAPVEEASS